MCKYQVPSDNRYSFLSPYISVKRECKEDKILEKTSAQKLQVIS
jgi:hypothetical protein